jgi:glucose/arabinose dehydrogenase
MKSFKLFLTSLCVVILAACVERVEANTPPAPEGLTLTPFVDGLELPVFITPVIGSNDKYFVLEKVGRVRVVEAGSVLEKPVLDVQNLVSTGNEQGLLGIALHPDYQSNGYIFINYTDEAGDTQIVRYQVSGDVADPNSAQTILSVDQPHSNHNAGMLTFGPDGYLYIMMGDGGSGGDPYGHGQNMDSLLGKMLRIDVNNGDPYAVPEDNPFVGQEGGDMWLGDVGQNAYEEISFQAAGQGGGNYGWRCFEATHEFDLSENCEGKEFIDPVLEYDHSQGASVTGGYVYRGSAISDLQGKYIFGDFTNGYIWLASQQDETWTSTLWQDTDLNISSFGEDADGELFVIDYRGAIYRLTQE